MECCNLKLDTAILLVNACTLIFVSSIPPDVAYMLRTPILHAGFHTGLHTEVVLSLLAAVGIGRFMTDTGMSFGDIMGSLENAPTLLAQVASFQAAASASGI